MLHSVNIDLALSSVEQQLDDQC